MESEIQLTEEQSSAIDFIKKNVSHTKHISLGGYAGTGKSTCLSFLTQLYPNFAVCAFTGKAANVLVKKGIHAKTIHSTIYNCEPYGDGYIFRLKSRHNLGNVRGFFVDEASMINKELFEDLQSFRLPIVFFGDHGQLEAIGTSCNLMKSPDVKLETIHRNANSIAKFASFLRDGNSAINWPSDERVRLLSKKNIQTFDMLIFDQIICAYNKTRLAINSHMRQVYRHEGSPKVNEKIICLKNNSTYSVYNGMQGRITAVKKNFITFKTDDGVFKSVPAALKQFNQEKLLESAQHDKNTCYMDYGYCITCHKAQGDEWHNILVIEEKCSAWDFSKWAYTAASRAKELLWWAI